MLARRGSVWEVLSRRVDGGTFKPDVREDEGDGKECPDRDSELADVPTADVDEFEFKWVKCLEDRRAFCCSMKGGTGGSRGMSIESEGSRGIM